MRIRQVVAPTSHRVERVTSRRIQQQLQRDAQLRVAALARRAEDIEHRLHQLDREWDIERAIELNAGIAVLVTLAIAAVERRLMFLPALIGSFLVLHAVQGWCPPVPVLRHFGFRTMREINQERYALKAVRGDFRKMGRPETPAEALDTARCAMAAAAVTPITHYQFSNNGH